MNKEQQARELLKGVEIRYSKKPTYMTGLPSPTHLLGLLAKPALINWAAREAAQHAAKMAGEGATPELIAFEAATAHKRGQRKAMNAGINVHTAIYDALMGQTLPQHPVIQAMWKNLIDFLRWPASKLARLDLERAVIGCDHDGRVWHPARWAGIVDVIAEYEDGTKLVADLKTSKTGPYMDHVIQVAAYAWAVKDKPEENVQAALIYPRATHRIDDPTAPKAAHKMLVTLIELEEQKRLFEQLAAAKRRG